MSIVRTVAQARNPKYIDPQHTIIDIEVDFDELDYDWVPFTCRDTTDDYPHVKDIFDRAVAGEWGPVASFEAPADVTGTLAIRDYKLDLARALLECQELKKQADYVIQTSAKKAEFDAYETTLQAMLDDADNQTVHYTFNAETMGMDLVGATIPQSPTLD